MKLLCVRIANTVLGPPIRRSGCELFWRCPNHDDRHPSLKLNPNKNCFLCGPCGISGGSWKFAAFLFHLDASDKGGITSQLREYGLLGDGAHLPSRGGPPRAALAAPAPPTKPPPTDPLPDPRLHRYLALPKHEITAIYPYTDAAGQVRYWKVRYDPKDFRIARPDERGGVAFGLGQVAPMLFRLPRVAAATQVVLAEGEKDVLTAERLGFTASTKPHGAGESIERYAEALRGKDVVICYDNDEGGRRGAGADAEVLLGIPRSLRVIFPPQGKDLTEWIERGGTREQLQVLIAQQPELRPPQSPAQVQENSDQPSTARTQEATLEKCPALPEEAWHGSSREYRRIVEPTTEAPPTYHLACFLTATGTALGRSVYMQKAGRHYPNVFMVLVGPSGGGRKSTALNLGVELLRAVGQEIGVVRTIDSREGFIEHLASLGNEQRGSGWASAMVRLGELRSLIDKTRMEGLRNIVPTLCDAYDCPASLEVRTRKNAVSVSNPTVSLLAATTRRWIDGLSAEDLEGGLGNRIAWVAGEPGAALPNPPLRNQAQWDALTQRLHSRIEHWRKARSTEFSLSPAAAARWEKIYAELYADKDEEALIAILCERLQNHCLKVALIYAALDGNPVIELPHLEAAYAFTQFLYDCLWHLFRGFGVSPMAQLDARIVETVKKAGAQGIRLRTLKKRFWREDMEIFNRRVFNLTVTDGPLVRVQEGQKIIILLAESAPEEGPTTPNT